MVGLSRVLRALDICMLRTTVTHNRSFRPHLKQAKATRAALRVLLGIFYITEIALKRIGAHDRSQTPDQCISTHQSASLLKHFMTLRMAVTLLLKSVDLL